MNIFCATISLLFLPVFISGIQGCGTDNLCPSSLDEQSKTIQSKTDTVSRMPQSNSSEIKAKIKALDELVNSCFKIVEDHKDFDGCLLNHNSQWSAALDRKGCQDARTVVQQLKSLELLFP